MNWKFYLFINKSRFTRSVKEFKKFYQKFFLTSENNRKDRMRLFLLSLEKKKESSGH